MSRFKGCNSAQKSWYTYLGQVLYVTVQYVLVR